MLHVETNHMIFSETLEVFTLATEEEVPRLVMNSSNATCDSDPIPTLIAKQCLLTPIMDIVNISSQTGVLLQQLKKAIVVPLLKKFGHDPDDLKNYRPISNYPYFKNY